MMDRRSSRVLVDVGPFFAAALLLAGATRGLIPTLVTRGWEPLVAWFAAGSGFVFAPMVLMGIAILRGEQAGRMVDRIRVRALGARDWWFVCFGLIAVYAGTAVVALVLARMHAELAPTFLRVTPLGPDRRWILLVWLPFWLLNTIAEEFTWRGVLLPRHEARWGRMSWFVHALLWAVFHVPFGAPVFALAVPTLLVVPLVAQTTRNTLASAVVHCLANGPPFLLIALGVV
jgi:membrane protease YdiL (CAAX protease family)